VFGLIFFDSYNASNARNYVLKTTLFFTKKHIKTFWQYNNRTNTDTKKPQRIDIQYNEVFLSGDAENNRWFFSNLPLRKCPGTVLAVQRP